MQSFEIVPASFRLIDSSKLGHEGVTPYASLTQVTHFFTDTGISEEWKSRLKNANIPFTICEKNASIAYQPDNNRDEA